MSDYAELNKKHNYQMPTPETVQCERWTVLVNGGEKTVVMDVPLPNLTGDDYRKYMRDLRDRSIQLVRRQAKESFGYRHAVRVRIANIERIELPGAHVFARQGMPS